MEGIEIVDVKGTGILGLTIGLPTGCRVVGFVGLVWVVRVGPATARAYSRYAVGAVIRVDRKPGNTWG